MVAAGAPILAERLDAAADSIVAAATKAVLQPLFLSASAAHIAAVGSGSLALLQLTTELVIRATSTPSCIWPLLRYPALAIKRPDLRVDDALHNPTVRRALIHMIRGRIDTPAGDTRLPPVCIATVRAVFPAGRDLPLLFPLRNPRDTRDPFWESDTSVEN